MTTVNATGKRLESLGMPWEHSFGYAQAVQVRDVIYVSGQLSHDDEGNIVAALARTDTELFTIDFAI